MSESRRLLIVSNRLPFHAHVEGEEVVLTPSTGGVASGLRVAARRNRLALDRMAWRSVVACPAGTGRSCARTCAIGRIVPVPLTRGESQEYYDGFCNSVLWPLLHYQIDRLPLGIA